MFHEIYETQEKNGLMKVKSIKYSNGLKKLQTKETLLTSQLDKQMSHPLILLRLLSKTMSGEGKSTKKKIIKLKSAKFSLVWFLFQLLPALFIAGRFSSNPSQTSLSLSILHPPVSSLHIIDHRFKIETFRQEKGDEKFSPNGRNAKNAIRTIIRSNSRAPEAPELIVRNPTWDDYYHEIV